MKGGVVGKGLGEYLIIGSIGEGGGEGLSVVVDRLPPPAAAEKVGESLITDNEATEGRLLILDCEKGFENPELEEGGGGEATTGGTGVVWNESRGVVGDGGYCAWWAATEGAWVLGEVGEGG